MAQQPNVAEILAALGALLCLILEYSMVVCSSFGQLNKQAAMQLQRHSIRFLINHRLPLCRSTLYLSRSRIHRSHNIFIISNSQAILNRSILPPSNNIFPVLHRGNMSPIHSRCSSHLLIFSLRINREPRQQDLLISRVRKIYPYP